MKSKEISFFLPCYNEADNITKVAKKVTDYLQKNFSKWELLLVNDGSKDKTLSVIKTISKTDPRHIKVVNHPQNRGYGAALKSGLYNSKYSQIAFMDSDGQFDIKDLKKLIDCQTKTGSDLVIGYYLGRKVPFYRIMGSKIWELAVFLLFTLHVRDIDCGFKLIQKKVIDTIPQLQAERGPFISSELLIKSKRSGFSITEVGVNHFARTAGEATGTKLNVVLSGLKDLLHLWFKINFAQ